MFGLRKRPAAPDQQAVVDRALCLSAVTMLGAIAGAVEAGEMDGDQAGKYLKESHRWLIREQLASALSIRERALLAKGIGDWTQREAADALGSTGSLGTLLWALSVVDEMPRSDVPYERLTELVPLLAPTAGFRASADLRSADAIAVARDLAATDTARRRALGWLGGEFADWDS